MNRIVLDTNVLISGMINAFGPPGRIIDRVREAELQLVIDDRIVAEYKDVLNRPKFKFHFTPSDAAEILIFLERNSHYIVPTAYAPDLPDPDDIPFLEVAISAKTPLVTGNIAHFPAKLCQGVKVFTAAQFLKSMV